MIDIHFHSDNKPLALAIGQALVAYGSGLSTVAVPEPLADTDTDLDAYEQYQKSVEDEARSAGAEGATTAPATGDTTLPGAAVDHNGVPFDANFCGKAAKPFYASGKRAGQWKKRQGVDDATYDTWYAEQLAIVPAATTTATEGTAVNTADAFGAGGGTAETEPAVIPTDCGAFMGWISELQAAGHLTQDQINAAYPATGISITDLFPPTDEATVAGHIAKLHAALTTMMVPA